MDYMVIATDGQEFGPATLETLKQWVGENRIQPQTKLRLVSTGEVTAAAAVSGLFQATPPMAAPPAPGNPYQAGSPQGNWAQPPSPYPRAGGPVQGRPYNSNVDVVWSIGYAVLALVSFFLFSGIGVILAFYGVMRAYRSMQAGHQHGTVAMVISVVAAVAVVIGMIIRVATTGSILGHYGR